MQFASTVKCIVIDQPLGVHDLLADAKITIVGLIKHILKKKQKLILMVPAHSLFFIR